MPARVGIIKRYCISPRCRIFTCPHTKYRKTLRDFLLQLSCHLYSWMKKKRVLDNNWKMSMILTLSSVGRCRWPVNSNSNFSRRQDTWRDMKLSKRYWISKKTNFICTWKTLQTNVESSDSRFKTMIFSAVDRCKWFPCKWSHFEARSMNECAWKLNKSVHCLKCLKRRLKTFWSHSLHP